MHSIPAVMRNKKIISEIIPRKENLSSLLLFQQFFLNKTTYSFIYSQMENGETGLFGGHALPRAEVELRSEVGHVPIQLQTMKVLPVPVLCLTSKTAQPSIAQLVNISITF